MELGPPIFSVKCSERDGEVVRTVRFAPLEVNRLRLYWSLLSRFDNLFGRHITSIDDFISTFVSQDAAGHLKANGLMWQIDDVGIFWLTDIMDQFQATGHFTFWDRKIRGREAIFKRMLVYLFETYNFHRIMAEIPTYSKPANAVVARVGFKYEGRLRKYTWYRGEWWDVNIYSVLKEESHGLLAASD